jgi:hypothetical protein
MRSLSLVPKISCSLQWRTEIFAQRLSVDRLLNVAVRHVKFTQQQIKRSVTFTSITLQNADPSGRAV